jgi:exosortase family protein XrtM
MKWSPQLGTFVDHTGQPLRRRRRPLRFPFLARVLVFVAVFGALQLCWEASRGGSFEWMVIHDVTVQPASWLVNVLTPDAHASARKFTLSAGGGGINIINGCEGTEALFLLIAAFVVAPMSWRSRMAGLLLGVPVVFAVNQARILVLFYAYRYERSWFDPLHATVTPVVVILLIALYFYVWLARTARPPSAPA